MPGTLKCEIVTPERQVYAQDTTFVVVPAIAGEMGVLPMHAPTISTLGEGEVRVTPSEGADQIHFAIAGGYVEVDGEKVIVLANRAQRVSEIDTKAVAEAIAGLEARLASLPEGDSQRAFASKELAWNQLLQKLSA